jgi:hypothetical protein
MREIRLSGSVEGVVSNHDPYSDSLSAVQPSTTYLSPVAIPRSSSRRIKSLSFSTAFWLLFPVLPQTFRAPFHFEVDGFRNAGPRATYERCRKQVRRCYFFPLTPSDDKGTISLSPPPVREAVSPRRMAIAARGGKRSPKTLQFPVNLWTALTPTPVYNVVGAVKSFF